MARKVLGQEGIFGQAGMKSDLDALHGVIDWCPVEDRLSGIYASLLFMSAFVDKQAGHR